VRGCTRGTGATCPLWKAAGAQTQALMVDYYQALAQERWALGGHCVRRKGDDRKPCNPAPLLLGALSSLGSLTPLAAKDLLSKSETWREPWCLFKLMADAKFVAIKRRLSWGWLR
jgi:hypothetical protein